MYNIGLCVCVIVWVCCCWCCCCCCNNVDCNCFWLAFVDAKLIAFAMAVVILFKYFGLRARISSKLLSSGGWRILDVVPVVAIIAVALGGSCIGTAMPPAFVVGGALIVALLQASFCMSICRICVANEWQKTLLTCRREMSVLAAMGAYVTGPPLQLGRVVVVAVPSYHAAVALAYHRQCTVAACDPSGPSSAAWHRIVPSNVVASCSASSCRVVGRPWHLLYIQRQQQHQSISKFGSNAAYM